MSSFSSINSSSKSHIDQEDITFLTSSFYHYIFDTTAWIVFAVSVLLYVMLMVIVIRKSPKEMKVYKWYIVFNYSLVFVIELILGLTHPRFLIRFPGIFTGKIDFKTLNSGVKIGYNHHFLKFSTKSNV